MDIRKFADVHPNWYVIRTLEPDETRALLDLGLTLMAVGDHFSPEQRSDFVHALLDGRDKHFSPERVQVMIWRTEERLAQCSDKELGKLIASATRTFKDDDVKAIAVLRLLSIMAMAHAPNVEELNLLQAIGYGLGIDEMTTEHFMRAAWESSYGNQASQNRARMKMRPPRQRATRPQQVAPSRAAAE